MSKYRGFSMKRPFEAAEDSLLAGGHRVPTAQLAPLPGRSAADRPTLEVALISWTGHVGGAETFSVELAKGLRAAGAAPSLLFVSDPEPLASRLAVERIPYESLGLSRGRNVLAHHRALAQATTRAGRDFAILPTGGYLAAALKVGGYQGRVIAVEHGSILQQSNQSRPQRFLRSVDRASGIWACDAEVAVSEFVLEQLRSRRHARRLLRIYNGVDVTRFRPGPVRSPAGQAFVVGCTARLFENKGVDDLIRARADHVLAGTTIVRVAGDGPDRSRLETLAQELGVAKFVQFEGRVSDVPAFWHGCDIAVVPSREHVESFCLAAVEPMACGLPVVATRNGALPEVISEGKTGTIVAPGDAPGLARAVATYRDDIRLREWHGRKAREDVERRFDLALSAASYLELGAAMSHTNQR